MAGVSNPQACADACLQVTRELGIKNLKVGIILGDDIQHRLDEIVTDGCELEKIWILENLEKIIKDKLLSANVYFGAFPIVQALKEGADIVITSRTTDTGLTLAPMIYEFEWKQDQFDLMAAGTVRTGIF